jgi:hypothetical protein
MYDMIHHLSGTCLLPWMSKAMFKKALSAKRAVTRRLALKRA